MIKQHKTWRLSSVEAHKVKEDLQKQKSATWAICSMKLKEIYKAFREKRAFSWYHEMCFLDQNKFFD